MTEKLPDVWTSRDYPVLLAIAAEVDLDEWIGLHQISERTGMAQDEVFRAIRSLEANGYLERTSDPSDRRSRLINYTDKGRRALDLASHIIIDIERDYAQAIGAEQYAAAKLAMARLIDSFQRD